MMASKLQRPLLFFCFLLFTLSSHAFFMMSEKKASEIGAELHEKILQEMPIYEEPELNAYVRQVGERIARHSDRPDIDYTFTIIDSPDINAFATPGGYIYINRGLIAYFTSEAQLAAVLGHEIGHVTARHAARQQRARNTSNVAAFAAAILTGSGEVGRASAMWGAATVSGYGRDMELEADELGAKFLARAGYNPRAVIDVLTLLKDHERFERRRARDAGQQRQTYHGLFATHPRNDQRLREVVSRADEHLTSDTGETNTTPFRIATNGLPWGRTVSTEPRRDDRFYHDSLRFRFDIPEGWHFDESGAAITGNHSDDAASLTLRIRPRTTAPPEEFIKETLDIPLLRQSQPLRQAGLHGHTGFIPDDANRADQRLAVIYYGRLAYVFIGEVRDEDRREAMDEDFMTAIGSFAPMAPARSAGQEQQRIHYVRATENASFAALARYLELGEYGEEQLRLINGYYPIGEPKTGEWIKIIR